MESRSFICAVPPWEKLPSDVQNDLREADFEHWYQDRDNTDVGRLTLLNLYLKLRNRGLWKYVNGPAQLPQDISPGCLEFLTRTPDDLRRSLCEARAFTNPARSLIQPQAIWQSREKETTNQLHLKNFRGWPRNRIQAHIDPSGFVWKKPWSLVRHLMDSDGYKNVRGIGQKLGSQGSFKLPQ